MFLFSCVVQEAIYAILLTLNDFMEGYATMPMSVYLVSIFVNFAPIMSTIFL